jgi:hypothetical protein
MMPVVSSGVSGWVCVLFASFWHVTVAVHRLPLDPAPAT